MRGPGEARLLASGALLQQLAQGSGLLALLVIVTLLARRLTVSELAAYGLISTLAGYLLVLRNSVSNSAVRAMAAAGDAAARAPIFSAAAVLYVLVGLATGAAIAVAAVILVAAVFDGDFADEARLGGLGLGALTAVGIPASVYLDALRAERRFTQAARAEIVSVALYLAIMLALILGGARLAVVIAASGALPLLTGTICAMLVRRREAGLRVRGVTRREVMRIVPTAGWLLVVQAATAMTYASGRIMLGAFKAPATVGLYEGPVRAHNLFYALAGALAVPTVPTASRYASQDDERRLTQLAVRGSRYTLALFVPPCVTLMVLAEPIISVWLGERYAGGATALTIIVAYWLLFGALAVTPGFLVGIGRARQVAQVMIGVAIVNLGLSLVLTPELGVEGPAVAVTAAFALAFVPMLRIGLEATSVRLGDLVRRAFAPAYGLGSLLAGALFAARELLEPDTAPLVLAVALGGMLAYWAACYLVWFGGDERALLRGLLRR